MPHRSPFTTTPNVPELAMEKLEQIHTAAIAAADAAVDRLRAARPPRVPQRRDLYLYVARNVVTGRLKIGVSAVPRSRVARLQTASADPLELILSIKGSLQLEREVHHVFRAHRLAGEWFAPAPKIFAWIERVTR